MQCKNVKILKINEVTNGVNILSRSMIPLLLILVCFFFVFFCLLISIHPNDLVLLEYCFILKIKAIYLAMRVFLA